MTILWSSCGYWKSYLALTHGLDMVLGRSAVAYNQYEDYSERTTADFVTGGSFSSNAAHNYD